MNSIATNFPADTGGATPSVELIEFGDFTCTQCRRSRPLLDSILMAFAGQVRYTYRHFPVDRCEASRMAAVAAEAAGRQGQFWPMYYALFTQPAITRATLSMLAISLGLQYHQFLDDLDDEELHHRIEANRCEGRRLGIMTTPTFFVGGQRFYGKLTQSRLAPIVRSQLSQYAQPVLSKVDIANGMIYWGRGE
ncbi:DsbA family protein [Fibrella aquatilis]|uniref:Thioredoxin domain-containing protein n=1 Tax=Fibrella aquatilis TaxID=2817059 RepID=A0A939G6A9_9BACT|nr:thioredoxin domain-containing protein [Fibrella aquatilis]MBO0931820.1 thioredoxin domain-containing protein [Fibrella aquatilis]